jgi:ABC-2 type transport system ATP-binding protein
MATLAVEVVDLVKRYGDTTAVDGISFSVPAGAVVALLGPNGAGKTSTVEVAEGFRTADGGQVRVLGMDPADPALRPRVGIMLQAGGVYTGARTAEMLRLVAAFHADPLDPGWLLETLGLGAAARVPYRRLSGGQQQRLKLAMAVIGRPELVFLDEPTAGLDPQARRFTWALIERLRGDGVAVLLTTHFMDEAERLADRVVVLDRGRVVAADTPAALTAGDSSAQLRFRALPGLPVETLARALPVGCAVVERPPGEYTVSGTVDPHVLATVTAWCAEQHVMAEDLRLGKRTLEEVYLELTGRELH